MGRCGLHAAARCRRRQELPAAPKYLADAIPAAPRMRHNAGMSARPSLLRTLARILLAGALLAAAGARAEDLVGATVDQFLKTQTKGLPGRVSSSVGALDPRTQLGPCTAMEPFVPSGSRLWGKSTVGVRCLGPSKWTIYVPVQINVFGTYVVAARSLSPGLPLGSDDLQLREGDLTALPTSVLTDPAQGLGKTLKIAIGNGQPLRGDLLVSPPVVQQGQVVRLVAQGAGYSVSNEGRALGNAAEGQIVQARTASGQVVSGIARRGGVVEIAP